MDAVAAPQHMRALNQANRVRLARAALKRRIADGTVTVADVVVSCPWEAESMTISDLLLSQHRWGHTRCRRFLGRLPLSETKTIGKLTDRQRELLAGALNGEEIDDPWAAVRRPLAFAGQQVAGGGGVAAASRVAISTTCPSGSRT